MAAGGQGKDRSDTTAAGGGTGMKTGPKGHGHQDSWPSQADHERKMRQSLRHGQSDTHAGRVAEMEPTGSKLDTQECQMTRRGLVPGTPNSFWETTEDK